MNENHKIYGYCRISTKEQNLERQVKNIKEKFPNAIIIKEVFTGTKQNRPEWNKLIKKIKPNDTIIFDEVSRMSRNANEGFETYKSMLNKEVNLIFLKERHINTESYKQALDKAFLMNTEVNSGNKATDNLINGIMKLINDFTLNKVEDDIQSAFERAEDEIKFLSQRTKEGMELARLNGKQIGLVKGTKLTTQKSIEAKKQIKKYAKCFNGSLGDEDTCKLIGISRNTYYKYKKEMLLQGNIGL